jgi:hypothetical protein
LRVVVRPGPGLEVIFLLRAGDGPRVEGKYVAGRSQIDPRIYAVALDDSCSFHRDVAFRFNVRPDGGGWAVIDHASKRVRIGGRSHAYGAERDRALTREAFGAAFPDYSVLPGE